MFFKHKLSKKQGLNDRIIDFYSRIAIGKVFRDNNSPNTHSTPLPDVMLERKTS